MAVLKYKTFWIALAIISIILFHVVRDAVKAHHRMLFSNHYRTHSMGLFPEWQPTQPTHDRLNNIIAIDRKLNILLIAFNDESEDKHLNWCNRDRDQAVLCYQRREARTYATIPITTIHRVQNRLIVIDLLSNTRFEADLLENSAERIFRAAEALDYSTHDLTHLKDTVLSRFGYPSGTVPLAPMATIEPETQVD